ncbi:MAG: diguanylate cyclase [Methylococcaceae bacterium]|nr:diguanylate cyclase [Methylococcaceae bacterium]
MRILVVDDSKTIRQVVAECLKTMGHEVVYAESGEQCLDYLSGHDADLVLMDVEMPGLNGVEATKTIRDLKKADWFPIIFLTSRNDDDTFCNGIAAGGDAYLPKPLNPLRLQFTVLAMERIYVMRQRLQKTQRELETANLELERLSYYDQLTGLANRRNFDSTLDRQFALARRNKSPMSLIICDIDYFKIYNDNYGHQQGDHCLAQVGRLISEQVVRPTDLACRYGGEEFTVILPDTGLQGARQVAEKIRKRVFDSQIPHAGSKVAPSVSLSLGVATYSGQFKMAPDVTKAADGALYKAKEQGRNRVEIAA